MINLFSRSKPTSSYVALEQIFNDVYNGIAIIDFNGKWLKVNKSLCNMLGYSKEELYDMDINNIIFKEDINIHDRKYNDLIKGEVSQYQKEQRYFNKKGSIVWFLISVSLTNNNDLNSINTIWQFTNITKQKNRQNKSDVMVNVLREQNERLKSFTDIICHNLRSHSSNLSYLVKFLKADYPWISGNETFQLLDKATENFEETLNNLTEVSEIKKVESSEIRSLNLNDFIEKAIYNISALARDTNTTILNKIDENLYVKGIPAYLDSIILNFLTNSIKYRANHRKPKIYLTSDVQNEYAILNVKDNGQGIDLDKYGDKLFKMYKTFHFNDDARGIGLFITKNQIESLGGKVIVTSEVNVGTEFSIYFKMG